MRHVDWLAQFVDRNEPREEIDSSVRNPRDKYSNLAIRLSEFHLSGQARSALFRNATGLDHAVFQRSISAHRNYLAADEGA